MSLHGVLTGGLKRNSDVNVLPEVKEVWEEVRDDANISVDWLIAGYRPGSRTDIIMLGKGVGGIEGCSASLPENSPVFGGCRLKTGRFVAFFYADEGTPVMQKGRASMHKNGVLNCFVGTDCEIEMSVGLTEETTKLAVTSGRGPSKPSTSAKRVTMPTNNSFSAYTGIARQPSSSTPETDCSTGKSNSNEIPRCNFQFSADQKLFPYSVLKDISDLTDLPPGVDPANREQFLLDDEFAEVFGIEKKVFLALPAWKRKNLKKEKGLF